MPAFVFAVDFLGLIVAGIGFAMAFRQRFVRSLMGRPVQPPSTIGGANADDPLTYVLRISGIMIMVFGIVVAGMLTLFHFA